MTDDIEKPGAEPPGSVEAATSLTPNDLSDLVEATLEAIAAGGGFGWIKKPSYDRLEAYWRGVLLVPERTLFLARLDGAVAGSAQLYRPSRNNEAQAFAATLATAFVAPWARGHGLARKLTLAVCERARADRFEILNLDVRETLTRAIGLYESLGFVRWGTNPYYVRVNGDYIAGHYYYKVLGPEGAGGETSETGANGR